MDIKERFELVEDDHLSFKKVKNKHSNRADLHAFLMLDRLFPKSRDMIVCSEHDTIWLDVESDQAETLTDEQILELTRCGVFLDSDSERLAMFT